MTKSSYHLSRQEGAIGEFSSRIERPRGEPRVFSNFAEGRLGGFFIRGTLHYTYLYACVYRRASTSGARSETTTLSNWFTSRRMIYDFLWFIAFLSFSLSLSFSKGYPWVYRVPTHDRRSILSLGSLSSATKRGATSRTPSIRGIERVKHDIRQCLSRTFQVSLVHQFSR